MFFILLILFVALPVAELAVLLKVHEAIELGPTLALVFLTGVLGAGLARWQGHSTLLSIQKDLGAGKTPAPHMLDAMMIFMAGMVLLTPGLITDTIGFLLLIPLVRRELRVWLRRWIERKLSNGSLQVGTWRGPEG